MITNEDLYLSHSLYFIWKITHFTFFDWCVPFGYKSWKFVALRFTIIVLSSILLILMMIFQSITFIGTLQNMASINLMAMSLIWFSSIPIAMHTLFFFIFRRKKLLGFFQRFQKMEEKCIFLPSQFNRIKIARRTIYSILLTSSICVMIGIFVVHFNFPDEPYFYTSNETLKDMCSSPFLLFLSLLTYFIMSCLLLMVEIVPPLIYYHSGMVLFAIGQELKYRLLCTRQTQKESASVICPERTENYSLILSIWSKYDEARKIVTKANRLFGFLLINNIGTKFSVVCTVSYSTLYYLFQNKNLSTYTNRITLILAANLTVYILRISTTVIFSSYLLRAAENLKIETSSILRRGWRFMEPEAREAMKAFRTEQERELVACPLNLFRITPSLMLTMAGFIVSYVIVLLQTKW